MKTQTALIVGGVVLGAAYMANKQGVTAAAIAARFIADHEGFSARAYPDAAGYSIGYGHFIQPGEDYRNRTISKAEGLRLLTADMATATAAVNRAVTVPLNNRQKAALISLAYNIGGGAFAGSTLVKKLNAGDTAGAAAQFAAWNKSQGRVLAALTTRRANEAALFTS
jgi:lysozyme